MSVLEQRTIALSDVYMMLGVCAAWQYATGEPMTWDIFIERFGFVAPGTMAGMTDIVERLRDTGCDREPFTPEHKHCKCRIASEAADEIERLRGLLKRADDATAWKTVPHLGYAFQDEVEAALGIGQR